MATKRGSLYKGCCYMCATNKGKVRQAGQAARQPVQTLRKVGRDRRVSRHDLGDAREA